MSVTEKIKSHMKKEGLKYTWLCSKIGISKSHLSNMLSGTKKYTPEINSKINKVLGTDFKL
jgi:antitoxin component HigA of HigAB toxin-antitoxin module